MAPRRRQTRTEAIELIVEALTEDLELGDELAAMSDHPEQRLQLRLLGQTTEPLPGKPDQRSTNTIV